MASRLKKGSAIAAAVIACVSTFEGLRTVAYRDPIGIPTVCFGETRGVKMGDSYTVAQCKDMLGDGLKEFETGMRACMKQPDQVLLRRLCGFPVFHLEHRNRCVLQVHDGEEAQFR